MYVSLIIKARSRTQYYRGKAEYYIFWAYVCSLSYPACKSACTLLQGGSNMTGKNCDLFTHKSSRSYLNHLVYCRLWPVRLYHIFSTISYKTKFSGGEGGGNNKHNACVLTFCQTSAWNIFEEALIEILSQTHKYPLFLSDFNKTWKFRRYFRQIV
jgi:hypothetical protein